MSDMAIEQMARPFTVAEYHRMAGAGVFAESERVELLDGTIVTMSPIGTGHWGRHADVVEYLLRTLGDRAQVAGQAALILGDRSEPQPDIAVLARRRYVAGEPPSPAEIYAVVELADSSLSKDTGVKQRLYARYGIADYLVVDLRADFVLHFHEPHDLAYRVCDRLGEDAAFELSALRGVLLQANAFLARGI